MHTYNLVFVDIGITFVLFEWKQMCLMCMGVNLLAIIWNELNIFGIADSHNNIIGTKEQRFNIKLKDINV